MTLSFKHYAISLILDGAKTARKFILQRIFEIFIQGIGMAKAKRISLGKRLKKLLELGKIMWLSIT